MLLRIKIKIYQNLEVMGYFLSCFDPPHRNTLFELVWRIEDLEVNTHCYDWLTLVYV